MNPNTDAKLFGDIVRHTMEFYDKTVSDGALRMWWATLEKHPIEEVRAGLQAHLQDPDRGRWAPKPADVIAHIESRQASQWPESDEAWSTALRAMDENDTVIWNDEIAAAWGIARPIAEAGDEVGARMAFREAYRREVRAALEEGRSPRVRVSAGHDPDLRRDAITHAEERGLITHDQAKNLLPPPEEGMADEVAGLLTGGVGEPTSVEDAQKRLRGIKELLGESDHSGKIEETQEVRRRREAARAAARRAEGA
ncbi:MULTISPECIES: hypothetical protein [unclassified Thioalkalivibrio]|uniref:hypothetical protein n=1 Tax=unclassified Thioalkalivibrio TaxID=2621013 RepID=UPI00037BCF37|nr:MULTISPECIES: hypothetical protein [unclassified Thioalkalivibrio]